MSRCCGLLAARLGVVSFFLLTATYATLNCSPFAFDMFIKPQLMPGLPWFVAWHHLLYAGAYALSVLTLLPDLGRRPQRSGRARAAHYLAILYVVAMGLLGVWLLQSPLLPRIWNNSLALPTALAALLPLGWLALIDHLSVAVPAEVDTRSSPGGGQAHLLTVCAGVAGYLWVVHTIRGLFHLERTAHEGTAAVLTALWALVLTATTFAIVYALATLAAAIASRTQPGTRWARAFSVAVAAVATCQFLRLFALPTISLSVRDAAWISAVAGACLASFVSGLALRASVAVTRRAPAPRSVSRHRWFGVAAALVALAAVSSTALGVIEQLDWAFIGQRLILVGEAIVAWVVIRRAAPLRPEERWSLARAVVPAAVALAALLGVPYVTVAASAATGDHTLQAATGFDRHVIAEPLFRWMSDLLVVQTGFDADYLPFLERLSGTTRADITIPNLDFGGKRPAAPGDHLDIYVLVIDSLRRDYVSPYNPAVTFTPNIASLAADSAVFRNAFTRHGGTLLAAPSIWAGAAVTRGVPGAGFERMNAFEKFVNSNGYRMAVNDYAVAPLLLPSTRAVTIDPGVPSVETDLCQNLQSLEAHLDATAADARPVFAYLSPMNIHIVNTRHGGHDSPGENYPGFYAPYASRLHRIDGCLGGFVSYLKQRGRYDRSIIVLTSDHGDSLGDNGYWGHGTWLFPEVVRIPLIIRLPPRMQASLSTDLERVAFSADIAPTLYQLAGQPVSDSKPPAGEALFVPPDGTLSDRRREAYLLTSSYGAAYGLLRENGRQLYLTDLIARREYAFDLSVGMNGIPVPITPDMRRMNERGIRDAMSRIAAFYKVAR